MEKALENWVVDTLNRLKISYDATLSFMALNGDAGFRRYFRLNLAQPLMAVYAPVATEDSTQFIRVCEWLKAQGVKVPDIFASDTTQGFLLIEDLGDTLLQQVLQRDTVDHFYQHAFQSLLVMQSSTPDQDIFPIYDAGKLDEEMSLCPRWFFEQLSGMSLTEEQVHSFDRCKHYVISEVLKQPKVVVHRDFHSRNLLVLPSIEPEPPEPKTEPNIHTLAMIDFQDAVIGPWTYDLVSLLKDCYIQWPIEDVERWALSYANMAFDAGILPSLQADAVLRDMHLMGLQRHIKVLGIFARLALRDQKKQYLDDLPLVVHYVMDVLSRYAHEHASLMALFELFQQQVLPAVQKQPWWECR